MGTWDASKRGPEGEGHNRFKSLGAFPSSLSMGLLDF